MPGNSKSKIIYHQKQKYTTLFNPENGFFARIEDFGAEEPTWSEDGPELLDISITNYCERQCDFCYRGSSRHGQHISLDDFSYVLGEAEKSGVFQIALGGGNPNQHPDFIEILNSIRATGIVPSYTTNGENLTNDILKATERYCGAMAISAYTPYNYLKENIKKIKNYNIKLNIHFILNNQTIETAIQWLEQKPHWLKDINAIIFLNYKPINPANGFNLPSIFQLERFFLSIQNSKIKTGFDSCCISGILKWLDTPLQFVEPCEASRFSAFISEDLKMYPCSFMVNTDKFGDLRTHSLKDIWKNHPSFQQMRNPDIRTQCKGCGHLKHCRGGCNFLPQINLCHNIPEQSDSSIDSIFAQ